ncbi:hypothetical protein BKA93DRAFT_344457 [Sparassis latifolia]
MKMTEENERLAARPGRCRTSEYSKYLRRHCIDELEFTQHLVPDLLPLMKTLSACSCDSSLRFYASSSLHGIPRIPSFLHSFFLVSRTVPSVAVAQLDWQVVRALVSADAKGFMKGLGLWFLLAISMDEFKGSIVVACGERSILWRAYLRLINQDPYEWTVEYITSRLAYPTTTRWYPDVWPPWR